MPHPKLTIAQDRSIYIDGETFSQGEEEAMFEALSEARESEVAVASSLLVWSNTDSLSLDDSYRERLEVIAGGDEPDQEEEVEDEGEPETDDDEPETEDAPDSSSSNLVGPDGSLTEDFPHVSTLRSNGIDTIQELLNYEEPFGELDGIGDKYARDINDALARIEL